MIREVITITRITANTEQFDLACGHKVETFPAEVQKLSTEAAIERRPIHVDCKECDDLPYRLHTRAAIRRSIPHRKSVQDGQPDRIADLLDEAGTELTSARRIIRNLVKLIEEAPVFEITWNDVGYIVEARKFIGLGGTVTVSEPMKTSEMNHADRT